jgi:xanthine dehydrogenase large subunit
LLAPSQDAIAKSSFYPNGTPGRLTPPGGVARGDVDAALKAAPHTLSGTVVCGGQKHMYMETQNAVATLVEDDSIEVVVGTQARVHRRCCRGQG